MHRSARKLVELALIKIIFAQNIQHLKVMWHDIKKILSTLSLLLIISVTAPAQSKMIVEHYSLEQGLPNNTVYCSIKDKDGFVWFGTWHGLCSFDGAEFIPFMTRQNRTSDIPPRKVLNMVEDSRNNLWIRNADSHLYIFDKTTESYHNLYNELKELSQNVQVMKIKPMDNGHVLILTRNKNIYEGAVDGNGHASIVKIYDASRDIDHSNMRLRRNIIGETANCVFWIGTDLKINAISKKNNRALLANIPNNAEVSSFAHFGQYMCIGTAKGDIYIVNINNGKTEHHSFPEIRSAVSCIIPMDGQVFVSSATGLYSFTKQKGLKTVLTSATNATSSYVDQNRNLWLRLKSGTLVRYNTGTNSSQQFVMPKDSLFDEMKFCDTGANGLFILMRNGSVWRYNHSTYTMDDISKYNEFGGYVLEPKFFDIDLDSDGHLWLSSTTNGVYKIYFPQYNFRFIFPNLVIPTDISTESKGVRALYQSRNGDLWIGNRNGELYCVDTATGNVKKSFKGDIGNVYHIMEDHLGNLWLSTKGAGLIKATPDAMAPQGMRITKYMHSNSDRMSISNNRVYYTYQDSKKRIWVCTFGGGLNLIEQQNGKIVFRNKNNGMKNYPRYDLYMNTRAIAEDKHGRLWVGTTDGLMSFASSFKRAEDIKIETYRGQQDTRLSDNDIFSLYKDSNGDIWMGIFGSGLNKINGYDHANHRPTIKSYNLMGQQGCDVVSSMVEDNHKCLWICTEKGLLSIKKGSAFAKSYDRFSGFPDVNIEDNTSIRLANGNILIGCRQGLIMFNPANVEKENNKRYNTFIVDFKVQNRALSEFTPPIYEGSMRYAKEIVLKHDQAMFTIEFATPNYMDNNQISYSYILDGYEEQWHNNGNNRIASYANIPPGHYKFRVKTTDENSPECVLAVTILPPWWATWWAYMIYIIITGFALYGIARLVLYMIRMRNEVYINDRLAELKIRFFTNVSHELRTPLTLIKSPIEELKSTETLSESGKEYLSLIDRNADKMLQLVNQILDFRKVQNGKMKLHISLADINEMLCIFRNEYHMLAVERDIAFNLELPKEHVKMWCDVEKIGIILNNLINNAFKYTQEGGTICVAMECDDNGKCRIRVEDNGVGIPESQLAKIFERFSQADNKISDDTAHAGTGIGLSLSKEYVNMHHGKIWAENLASGVAFIVELPTDKEHFGNEDTEVYFDDTTAENNNEDETPDTAYGTDGSEEKNEDIPTLLLIEDNIDLCRMLQLQLRNKYNIFIAHNGEEGLKKVYQYHPDVIITDLMMPGIDGMELLRRVRHDFIISHIPVIVLTAKQNNETKTNAIAAGANAYITKPFSSEHLMARIHQLLDEQRIFQRKMVVYNTMENKSSANNDEYEQHLVKKDVEFVHKIHEIIEQNLNTNDFNIDIIAETIGLSRSAFFKKLKSLTGLAPVDLVKEIRLSKAAGLIETTDNNITEIAYSVGFHDAGYFGKCFRKKYGMTPKEYRNMKRNGQ